MHFYPILSARRLTPRLISLNCSFESWRGFEQPPLRHRFIPSYLYKIYEGCRSMETGTVKWFNNAKGFGFICPEGGGEDIFAHYSTIQMDGYRTLKAGQSVQFDVHQGQKAIMPVSSCLSLKQKLSHSSSVSLCTSCSQNASLCGWHFYLCGIIPAPEHLLDPDVPHSAPVASQTTPRLQSNTGTPSTARRVRIQFPSPAGIAEV